MGARVLGGEAGRQEGRRKGIGGRKGKSNIYERLTDEKEGGGDCGLG